MKLQESDITLHQAVDHTDPGFAVKGHKLRWISGVVEVRRAGRMWRVLKMSHLPPKVADKLKQINPGWEDGDTIRRRDLILAIAPLFEVQKRRQWLRDSQEANEAIFKGKRQSGAAVSEGSVSTETLSMNDFK